MKKLSSLFALCSLALAGFAVAADWPQWRGPDRTDVSKETGLLKSWPEGGPKLLWTFREAGEGYSAPAIIGDTLYCMGADDKNESIYALDLKTQTKKWSTPLGPHISLDRGDGPRGAPTVDGDQIFGMGSQGNLICVKTSTGEKVWLKELKGKDIGGSLSHQWGYSESPLVDGDQVVCTPGGKNGAMAAFNKQNGDLIWRSKDWTDSCAYSSIMQAEIGGIRQYVQMTEKGVAGVAAKDGALLWLFARQANITIPTPIISGDYVFVASGYGVGDTLIKITKDGDKFKADEAYSDKDIINHHGGVILVDGNLYGYSDGGKWVCKEMIKGNVLWAKGKDETKLGKGSLTCADGCFYCYSEDEGTVALVPVSPEGWKEKGRFNVPEKSKTHGTKGGGKYWTHPVVSNGKLYLRDKELLWCYDVKGGTASR
jgi:outer membrane protein assembly factor BamB